RTKARWSVASNGKRSRVRSRPASMRQSVSVRMCRRYSCGSKDIGRFRPDVGTDMRRERPGRNQLDPLAELGFQKIRERPESIEALLPWPRLDEEIHIAVGPRFAAHDRAEKRKPVHPETPGLGFSGLEPGYCFLAGECALSHAGNVRPGR